MQTTLVREYRIAAMYQRCCWYVIVGFTLIAVVAIWLKPLLPQRGPVEFAFLIASYALFPLAMVVPLSWKLRLDEHGVSRRLLFYWDSWSWPDFASGRIRKLVSHTLLDPERPWWRRRLGLRYLEDCDRNEVLSAINAHYVLPPPPSVPDELSLRYGYRRRATFDEKGIHLFTKNVPREYLWEEVRYVHVTRLDALRRDFWDVAIALPDQVIELKFFSHQGGASPTWNGASAEEINEFLFAKVPQERIKVSLVNMPLKNREHIIRKLLDSEKQLREWRIVMSILLVLLIGCAGWMVVEDGLFKAIAILAVTIPIVLVIIYMDRGQRQRIAELNAMLESATNGSKGS